jgi:hypothetical protein
VEETWAAEWDESRQEKKPVRTERGTAMTVAHSLHEQGLIDIRTVHLFIAPAAYFSAQCDKSSDFCCSAFEHLKN